MAKQGTCGYHGLVCLEQNHSSLLVHLNYGHRRESQYCKDPHTLVKYLLQREHKHVNKWNNILHDKKMQIDVSMEQFNYRTLQCTRDNYSTLSVKIFLMSEKSVQRIVDYKVDYISDLHSSVRSKSHPTAPAQNCYMKPPNEYFSYSLCEVSCAYEHQCVHSLAENGGTFVMSQFDIRHLRQYVVSGL